jgi:phage shock protein C
MQPRLTRSTTETMIAGVCGGLAEYFNIDPVIVRLIFVLVTLTSGLGIPVYFVLWIIMPKAGATTPRQNIQQGFEEFGQDASRFGQELSQEASRLGREVFAGRRSGQGQARSGAGAPPDYRFDPYTGQPISPDDPQTGATVNLGTPDQQLPTAYPAPSRRARRWSTLGLILIGIEHQASCFGP